MMILVLILLMSIPFMFRIIYKDNIFVFPKLSNEVWFFDINLFNRFNIQSLLKKQLVENEKMDDKHTAIMHILLYVVTVAVLVILNIIISHVSSKFGIIFCFLQMLVLILLTVLYFLLSQPIYVAPFFSVFVFFLGINALFEGSHKALSIPEIATISILLVIVSTGVVGQIKRIMNQKTKL